MQQFHIDPTDSNYVYVNGRRLARVRGAETPPAGVGQGTVADPAQPEGQGAGQQQNGTQPNGDFWGMFPNVPEEHRPLLEPHIKTMQGHVTQLEQQLSPLKPVFDQGFTPDQIVGLAQFSQAFDQDPKGTWLAITRDLQQNGLIHEDLDVDALQVIADGGDVPDEPEEPQDPEAGAQGEEEIPGWAQELQQKIAEREEREQQAEVARQTQAQDRLLAKQMEKARSELKEAGFDETLVTDKRLIGSIVANGGDTAAAIKDLTDLRSGLLKNVVESRETTTGRELELENGAPPTKSRRTPRDAFEGARGGAEQFLKQQQSHAAQEG